MDPGGAMIAVFFVVAALIVASVPIYKLMGWWVEGAVEPLLAAIGIALYIALIAGVMGAPSGLKIVLVVVLVISAVLTPVFGQVSDKVQLDRMEDNKVTQYSRVLEQNPMNHAARIALAESLYKRGDLDLAIEHLGWTLQQSPALSLRIRPQLESWKREKDRQGVPQAIFCHLCRAENPHEAIRCEECGAAFGTRAGMEQRMWRDGGPKVVIRAWIVSSVAVIFCCAMFLYLPIIVSGPLILASVIVGAWLFLRWVGGDMGVVTE